MRVVMPRSEVVTDDAGWTWLQARPGSTRARHTFGSFLLAVLILLAMATSTLLPAPWSIVATLVVVVVALALFGAIVRGAGSRVAMSGVGIYLQNGGRALQVGWPAVRGVTATGGRRLKIQIDDGYRSRTTRATFDGDRAREWLRLAAAEAVHRQLEPDVLDDDRGFRSRAA